VAGISGFDAFKCATNKVLLKKSFPVLSIFLQLIALCDDNLTRKEEIRINRRYLRHVVMIH